MDTEHDQPQPQMLNVCADGKFVQRPLDHVQVMPRGQMSRMVPKLNPGEEVHYTGGGGIIITSHPVPPSDYVTEIRFDPDSGQCPKYIVTYADGREQEVSKEYAEDLRNQMVAQHAKS